MDSRSQPLGFDGVGEQVAQARAVWLGHVNVPDQPVLTIVEGQVARVGEVEELVEDDKLARLCGGAQAADCVGRDHVRTFELSQRLDVGAVVDFVGREVVAFVVARQEDDFAVADRQDVDLGRAVARFDLLHAQVLAVVESLDA